MRLKKLCTLFTLAILGMNSLTPITQVVAEELPSIATTETTSSESTSSTTEISKEETTEETKTSSSEKEKTSETKENETSIQTQPSTETGMNHWLILIVQVQKWQKAKNNCILLIDLPILIYKELKQSL